MSGKLKAVPEYNYMFLTCNKTTQTQSGIILTGDSVIEDEQIILKVGEGVRNRVPGEKVKIDPRPYIVKNWKNQNSPTLNEEIHKQEIGIAWPIEEIDGVEVMVVPDNHIRYHWPVEKNKSNNLIA